MTMNDETITAQSSLAGLRSELDAIDDGLLDLLIQRLDVTARVKAAKQSSAKSWPLPIRPAREAEILRRLLARAKGSGISPEFLVRLWRGILSDSSNRQSQITIHVSRHLNANIGFRLRLRDHFGPLHVEEWRDDAQALMQINADPKHICVVETEQNWVDAFAEGMAGEARVISVLPILAEDIAPKLLVLGQAPSEPTGDDETLVITNGKLPRDFTPEPLWQAKVGKFRLSALPGFLDEHESPLVALMRQNTALGLKVAGRYAAAIRM
jgi:chorismate mutase / prephenate dehydratase